MPTTQEASTMDRRTKLGIGGAAAVLVIGAGSFLGIAAATGGDSDEELTGSSRDRAVAAALASTGGGQVLETEAGDDGAAYTVEIKKPDGSVVEVQLDADYTVTGDVADDDGSEGAGEDDD
jgi:uncharacterized membrane protein YkoI